MKIRLLCSFISMGLLACGAASALAQTAKPAIGPNGVTVHGQFGGDIFGFDIDPNGTEGLLCEFVNQSGGGVLAAIETFDQTTGAIIRVVSQAETGDDFVTLGIAGQSIGIVEREHSRSTFDVIRRYRILNPLNSNRLTGSWNPRLDQNHIINQIRPSPAGDDEVAVYALDVSQNQTPFVFTSHVAANTFSAFFPITDPVFTTEAPPVMAFDTVRNQVILGHDFPSAFIVPPRIGFLDLATGNFSQIEGKGLGVINGVAVDTADAVLCTDTVEDTAVQFYDLNTLEGHSQFLPGHRPDQTTAAGGEIQFDPINKLFLITQEFSEGLLDNGSSIQVYSIDGHHLEQVDGLLFQGGFNVFPTHVALNPSRRLAFVNGPDLTKSLQAFTY